MRERYTLFLSGVLDKSATQTKTFQYDFRSLIPVAKRGGKFLVLSAFDTGNLDNTQLSGLIISCNLPQTYNKSYSSSYNFVLGIAQPTFNTTTSFKYQYPETAYLGKMIDFPELSSISITIASIDGTALAENAYFFLHLTFEELD